MGTTPLLVFTLLRVIGFAYFLQTSSGQSVSPCDESYSILPHHSRRFLYNTIDNTSAPIQDIFLPEGWYRSTENMTEQTPSDINMCGTNYPIWLSQTHPIGQATVKRTACLYDRRGSCRRSFTIKIAHCTDFYLYYLVPTGLRNTAYCFGIGKQGKRPQFEPEKPTVTASLLKSSGQSGRSYTQTVFKCIFKESQSLKLQYLVQWYMDGNYHFTTKYGNGVGDEHLYIKEDTFVNANFKMGVKLSCTFTAHIEEFGPASRLSPQSDGLFIGIEILTPSLEFEANDLDLKRSIKLKPTVPIGCQEGLPCDIKLTTYLPYSDIPDICTGIAFQSNCGIRINNSQVQTILELPIVVNDVSQYNPQRSFQIHLQTEDTNVNDIWGNYRLPTIPVTILNDSSTIERRRCLARNDPHLSTFDGKNFDDHTDSTKILYRNIEYDTEVQITYRQCSKPQIRCICGIAVKAGSDVYMYDLCNTVKVGYLHCDKDVRSFTVRYEGSDFKVYFTYGTYVSVSRVFINLPHYHYGTFIRVEIYPTRLDEGKTRGLCGIYNGKKDDDFHARDGSKLRPRFSDWGFRYQPQQFLKEWSVSGEDDMFSMNFDVDKLSQYTNHICICENTQQTSLNRTISCSTNGQAKCRQQRGREIYPKDCASRDRRRRSSHGVHSVPAVDIHNFALARERNKREVQASDWSFEEAKNYCRSKVSTSEIHDLCLQVPTATPSDFLEMCAVDTEMTNSTDWVQPSLDSFASDCLAELQRNVTILVSQEAGQSILDEVSDLVCPNNCSFNGICQKGICICYDQIGGHDCSIDLTIAPSLSGLHNDGLCDIIQQSCTHVSLFGGAFDEKEDIQCTMDYFEMDVNGGRLNKSAFQVIAEYITFVELECKLPPITTIHHENDVFVYGFSISVTYGGDLFSYRKDYFVYNSECQEVINVSGEYRFMLIDGYCFFQNQCVRKGDILFDQVCDVCKSTGDTRQSPECIPAIPLHEKEDGLEEETSDFLQPQVIASVVGGSVILVSVITACIIVIRKRCCRAKRRYSPQQADARSNTQRYQRKMAPKETVSSEDIHFNNI